ncbi:Rap1 Myb domain-containing protein [Apiosordaria backusii]|uniref:DNA-binding protein RAP1 n=1 Tax=Apiosordaria backusii TaxID=314023 RepID=A0AA40EGE9_9PEZI|nr:Rap1 Myb domain-containing protein [Apiosordaria backusii]
MPPPTVYEGVNGSYEGTLFNGLKFWVSKRVPLRSDVVAKIKNNGGKTVEMEKLADVLIWDNLLPRGAPPGAISFKFVDDCVSKGEIVNKEEYLVTSSTRPVGSSVLTQKGTKNSFTPQDDQILLNWIRQKEEEGASIKGLAIYQELAKKYPHHTYQSWRSRFVDKLSHLPRQSVRPLPPPTATPVKSRSSATNARVAPSSTAPVATPSSLTPSKGPGRRVPFTEEDDRILIEYVHDRWEAKSGNKIYKELEEQYPHHTWQSWRDRWVKTLSKRRNSAPGEITDAEPIRAPRPRHELSASELPPAKRPRTSTLGNSTVQSTAPVAPPSTQLGMSEEEQVTYEALKEKMRKMKEAKAARTSTSGQTKVPSRAVSSNRVGEPGNEVRPTSAVSSTPLASGSREDELRKEELKQKMKEIRAERARKPSSTPGSTRQGESRRASIVSNNEPLLQPQPKKKRKEPPTPTPTTNQTPGFRTQVSMPSIDSPGFQTQVSNPTAETPEAQGPQTRTQYAQNPELEPVRARSRESMAGLITSRESWLGLRRIFHEFNQEPEPSETLTVFGREVDCWDLWSGVVREGYPPSPAAWVRIAEDLGFTDDQDLLDEGQRSVVQALRDCFMENLREFWLATEWFAGVVFEPVEAEGGDEEGEEEE